VASLGSCEKLCGEFLSVIPGRDAGIAVAEEWLASEETDDTKPASGVLAGRLGLVRAGHADITP